MRKLRVISRKQRFYLPKKYFFFKRKKISSMGFRIFNNFFFRNFFEKSNIFLVHVVHIQYIQFWLCFLEYFLCTNDLPTLSMPCITFFKRPSCRLVVQRVDIHFDKLLIHKSISMRVFKIKSHLRFVSSSLQNFVSYQCAAFNAYVITLIQYHGTKRAIKLL